MYSKRFFFRFLIAFAIAIICYFSFVTLKRKYIIYDYFHQGRWEELRLKYDKIKKTRNSTLFFGDSLTENFKSSLPESDSIKNMGISGDFSEGLIKRIDNVINYQPDKIFLMIGINDIVEKVPLTEIETNYLHIYEILKSNCPNTTIYFQSTLPTRDLKSLLSSSKSINKTVVKLNEFIKKTAKEKNIAFIDLYSEFIDNNNELKKELTTDGIHLNKAGYQIWLSLIRRDI